MDIACTKEEEAIFERIAQEAGRLKMSSYLIGGFVRDKLLGRPTKDADIVCVGNGIELAHAVAATFPQKPAVHFFKTFGTAQFKLNGFDIEFVGARKESYYPESRKPEVAEGTLEDDQNRRDFTINTLAISLNKADYGQLLDPFSGLEDLENKLIRTPLDPDITFSDDPLRMMRGIRFASQLGFTIYPETLDAIARNAHRIKIVSQERVTDELNISETAPKPAELKMAITLIDQLTGKFDIAKYKDTYASELMKLIEAKAKGKKLPKPTMKVVHSTSKDLMEQLKASLETKKKKAS